MLGACRGSSLSGGGRGKLVGVGVLEPGSWRGRWDLNREAVRLFARHLGVEALAEDGRKMRRLRSWRDGRLLR